MTLRSSRLPLLALALLTLAGRAFALDTAPTLQRYFAALDRAYTAWQNTPLHPSEQDIASVRQAYDEAATAKAELVLLEGRISGDDLVDLEKQLTATIPCLNGLRDWLAAPSSAPKIPAPKPAPVRKLFHLHNTPPQTDPSPLYRQGGSTYQEPIAGSNLVLKHITPHLSLLGGSDRTYLITPTRKSYRIDRTALWALGLRPQPIAGSQPLAVAKPESQILAAGAEHVVHDLRSNDAATAATTVRLLSTLELALFVTDLQCGQFVRDLVTQEKADRLDLFREHLATHPRLKGEKYEAFEAQLLRARALTLAKDSGAPAAVLVGQLQGSAVDLVVVAGGQNARLQIRPSTTVTLEHGMIAVAGETIALDELRSIEPSTYDSGPKFTLSLSSLWHRHKKE